MLLAGRPSSHLCGDSRSVCASSKLACSSEHPYSSWSMERKASKYSSQATSPSPPYMKVDKRLKNSPMMETSSRFEKNHEGRRVQESMKGMERLNTIWEETTCRMSLLLAPEMLMVLEPPTCQGDLTGKKSQLDLRPFGVGVSVMVRKVIPWSQYHIEE